MTMQEKKMNHIQRKENKHFGPISSCMMNFVYAKGLKGCENDKNSRPTMVKREWKMYKELIIEAFSSVVFLDYIIDVLGIGVRNGLSYRLRQ